MRTNERVLPLSEVCGCKTWKRLQNLNDISLPFHIEEEKLDKLEAQASAPYTLFMEFYSFVILFMTQIIKYDSVTREFLFYVEDEQLQHEWQLGLSLG